MSRRSSSLPVASSSPSIRALQGRPPMLGWIVDAQADFLTPPESGGRLYVRHLAESADPGGQVVVPIIARVVRALEGALDGGRPGALVFTGDFHGPDDPEIDAAAPDPARGTYPPHCMGLSHDPIEREGAALVPEVRPRRALVPLTRDATDAEAEQVAARAVAGEPVFVMKHQFSVFAGQRATPAFLTALSRTLAVTSDAPLEVVVCGVATDVCVKAAVEGLLAWRGPEGQQLRITVISDAIWGLGLMPDHEVLAAWEAAGARVIRSAQLVAELAQEQMAHRAVRPRVPQPVPSQPRSPR